MKVLIISTALLVFFALLANCSAAVAQNKLIDVDQDVQAVQAENAARNKRFTCDFLGNQAICVLHCYAQMRPGGYCSSKGVCICRKP